MTLFSANLTPFLFFRDVNYPTSLQSTTLDGVTSSLLMRNIQNTRGSARYSPNKLNEKLERSVQDGGIIAESEGIFHIFHLFVCKNRNIFVLTEICCLIYYCLSVSRK